MRRWRSPDFIIWNTLMKSNPRIHLSGFADEAANDKTAVQQFSAFAALGLQYYSMRRPAVVRGDPEEVPFGLGHERTEVLA